MSERQIFFKGPEVRAILDGRKTQTRRPVKPQPGLGVRDFYARPDGLHMPLHLPRGAGVGIGEPRRSPYGQPGDVLWVRETWSHMMQPAGDRASKPALMNPKYPWDIRYRADGVEPSGGRWRPSTHMPKWVCRLRPRVTEVRVERLQDISEEDARAEGILAQNGDGGGPGAGYKWVGVGYEGSRPGLFHTPGKGGYCSCVVRGATPVQCAYRDRWDSIYSKTDFAWARNPWVWVGAFEVVK